MRKMLLLTAIIILCAWRYSGGKQVVIESVGAEEIKMTNNSVWIVFEEDRYRLKEWKTGDLVKLIESKGFFLYTHLALNLYRNDVVHVRAINDGK